MAHFTLANPFFVLRGGRPFTGDSPAGHPWGLRGRDVFTQWENRPTGRRSPARARPSDGCRRSVDHDGESGRTSAPKPSREKALPKPARLEPAASPSIHPSDRHPPSQAPARQPEPRGRMRREPHGEKPEARATPSELPPYRETSPAATSHRRSSRPAREPNATSREAESPIDLRAAPPAPVEIGALHLARNGRKVRDRP